MTFTQFYREAFRRSLHKAWHLGHTAHALLIFATGGCVWARIHFEEGNFIYAPFTILVISFVGCLFWYAYAIYADEHTERLRIERSTNQAQRATITFMPETDRGSVGGRYRIGVENKSGTTVQSVRAAIVASNPPLAVSSIPLKWSEGKTGVATVNILPGEHRFIEVFRAFAKNYHLIESADEHTTAMTEDAK